ncbi:ABC transporter permease [Halobacillus shinanisalinarum]|uniref:ABC transporter permease n=1 Tax=Halobacillus shinanisalinarum TaxID=2932258 RepID=A0ABY4H4H2_9BACI|nr:ABC transporter permease [Halobacillus shinanisalinarum]UOQ95024.1 ABC transporter permease [Halobacillus shinanisalinarum]
MLLSLLSSELLKIRKTKVWLLLFVSPILAGVIGFTGSLPMEEGMNGWVLLFMVMVPVHSLLLLPLMVSVFSGFICRYEHQNGGWRRLFSMPITRQKVYAAKFLMVLGLVALNQMMFSGVFVLVGSIKEIGETIPLELVLKCMAGGLISTLPLIAVTLWLAMIWSSFAAPFTVNVILTLPNMLVANSETFGPIYPWVQPFMMMMPKGGVFSVPIESLTIAIGAGFIIFYTAGSINIQKRTV